MAWIACQEVFDINDDIECLNENWNDMNMCRYCADIDEHTKEKERLANG